MSNQTNIFCLWMNHFLSQFFSLDKTEQNPCQFNKLFGLSAHKLYNALYINWSIKTKISSINRKRRDQRQTLTNFLSVVVVEELKKDIKKRLLAQLSSCITKIVIKTHLSKSLSTLWTLPPMFFFCQQSKFSSARQQKLLLKGNFQVFKIHLSSKFS